MKAAGVDILDELKWHCAEVIVGNRRLEPGCYVVDPRMPGVLRERDGHAQDPPAQMPRVQ